jgi:hypothetical protein
VERELFDSIERMTLRKDGRPLHSLPDARNPSSTNSSIFVVDYADLMGMPDLEIQDVYREKHVCIDNLPPDLGPAESEFGLPALGMFGNLDVKRDFQGKFYHLYLRCFLTQYS